MNSILCILFPSVIGLTLYCDLIKNNSTIKNLLFIYIIIVLVVNFISTFICVFIFDLNVGIEFALTNYPIFALKYIFLSSIVSLIIAIIIKSIKMNLNIELSVEKNENKVSEEY